MKKTIFIFSLLALNANATVVDNKITNSTKIMDSTGIKIDDKKVTKELDSLYANLKSCLADIENNGYSGDDSGFFWFFFNPPCNSEQVAYDNKIKEINAINKSGTATLGEKTAQLIKSNSNNIIDNKTKIHSGIKEKSISFYSGSSANIQKTGELRDSVVKISVSEDQKTRVQNAKIYNLETTKKEREQDKAITQLIRSGYVSGTELKHSNLNNLEFSKFNPSSGTGSSGGGAELKTGPAPIVPVPSTGVFGGAELKTGSNTTGSYCNGYMMGESCIVDTTINSYSGTNTNPSSGTPSSAPNTNTIGNPYDYANNLNNSTSTSVNTGTVSNSSGISCNGRIVNNQCIPY